jgi:type II secretory pathway pseudopilin PulG
MLAVWTALIGVIAGGLVSLASTLIQQQRTWRREDQIRTEAKAIEQRRDERREVLKLFTEFLTACNRANIAYALPDTSSQPAYDQVQSYRDLIAERWAAVQGAGVVFMAVGHDQPTREAISGLIDATETLTVKLRHLDQPSAQDMADFSARRKDCERAMRDYLAGLT